MQNPLSVRKTARWIAVAFFSAGLFQSPTFAQVPPGRLPPPQAEKEPAAEPSARIELLETHVRFETDGGARREVHVRVHINGEGGVREFGRLSFDYNRSFEQVDVPLVRVTHTGGGTADILPSAINDQPVPAVADAPAYQDVRRKSVRVIGLQPGDTLEYRVVTTVAKHPLAPDFYLSHNFARGSAVSQEIYELDLPASRPIQVRVSPSTPPTSTEKSGDGENARIIYRWQRPAMVSDAALAIDSGSTEPDLVVTTFESWQKLSGRLATLLRPSAEFPASVTKQATELTHAAKTPVEKIESIYDFVSQKIRTVDLPLGSAGFCVRPVDEILASGYATAEDKFALFAALSAAEGFSANSELTGTPESTKERLPTPLPFTHLLIAVTDSNAIYWLDPSLEVAPFGVVSTNFRGRPALSLIPSAPVAEVVFSPWNTVPQELPFPAAQRVNVNASLSGTGTLTAHVHYELRGDNELLLRIAFHQQTRDKWKDLAQLLSLSDGFRGQVSNATASDPVKTHDPFIVQYDITQANFVDWKKQPVRIPALLPQIGLPEAAEKSAAGKNSSPIELGTPLEVETRATLRLPPGTNASAPAGTSLARDYATYSSRYTAKGSTLRAQRRVKFILRELEAGRAADYATFLRAVQSDAAQEFILKRSAPASSPVRSGKNHVLR